MKENKVLKPHASSFTLPRQFTRRKEDDIDTLPMETLFGFVFRASSAIKQTLGVRGIE